MTGKNLALVCIKCELISGQDRIRSLVSVLSRHCVVLKVSNVYKMKKNLKASEFNSELWTVIKVETGFSKEELNTVLQKFSRPNSEEKECTTTILTFNDIVWLQPELPIPNPALIDQPVILKCAVEVWDSYEHPILGATLGEIASNKPLISELEFFAQGKSLLS
jgi:hypothetical protein